MCLFTNIDDLGWSQSCRHSQADVVKLAHRGLVNGADLLQSSSKGMDCSKGIPFEFLFSRHGKSPQSLR
jgi:hypothetical protein